ncbi:MAG: hypothetical protein KAI38_06440 [Candidatus Latescibacteria bacterium]|nr:hypothetical protein [Candidatus Latescibacterota bacterium]
MKTLKSPIAVGLVILVMMSIMGTDVKARPLTEVPKESLALAQDAIPTGQEAKWIELLDASLQSLSDKARRDRRIGGYVLLGLGVGTGVGGAATLAFADGDDARIVGVSLLGGAVLFGGLSLLPFKIPAEVERIYQEFGEMPGNTSDQVRHKFYYGDRRFEELAEKRRRERLVAGSVSILVGIANLIWIDSSEEESRIAVFAGPVIGGVTALLVKSEEERRFATYRRAKEDLAAQPDGLGIRFGLAPLPEGGMFGAVQVRF